MHEPRPPPIQPVDGGLLTFDRVAGRYPRLPEGVTFDVELLWAFAPRWEIDLDDAGVRFEISVTGDMPACAALLETWLRRHGYDDVEITVAQETAEVDPHGR